MLKPIRKTHDDGLRFSICVLWLIGFSASTIASRFWLRRSQVLGVVNRDYPNRASMTDADRRQALQELEELRFDDYGQSIDGGRLDGLAWMILPLTGRKARAAAKPPAMARSNCDRQAID